MACTYAKKGAWTTGMGGGKRGTGGHRNNGKISSMAKGCSPRNTAPQRAGGDGGSKGVEGVLRTRARLVKESSHPNASKGV